MFQKLRGILTVYDKILIISILLITIIGISWSMFNLVIDSQNAKYVIIEHKGQVLNKIRLTSDFKRKITIKLEHEKAEVMIKNGQVRMLKNTCSRQICVETGWISEVGEMITCIPNQIIIAIETQDSTDKIDAISY